VQAQWRTPIARWVEHGGRPFPGRVPATWDLDDGELVYIEGRFRPETFAENVTPATERT
jgi:hypothetical protein